ncbi:MAG: S1C family serine protease, partial [Acidimicrobiia bacterium]|nr:S1C family serine protease [Acidimicrobiia bacterium]
YRSSPVGNGRVILAFAAGALVIAAISIWSNSPDSVISDTAAAVSIVSSPPELGLAQGTAVASLGESPIPTTTTTEVSSRSAQALYAETVSPPPPWAYEVLSGSDGFGSSTLATAIRIDGLTPEFLITSASALGQRREVMLKGHAPGREQPELMPALVVGSDSGSDIAVLRVGVGNETPFAASIGSQDLAELGSAVEIRSGVPSTAHSGKILSMTADVIETSAPIPTGHLGAAVVNARGRVIGVVVDSPSMLASAIPVAECQRIAANIADYGVANPNWLGITITMSDGLVEVVDVVADGPADRAGISVGDRLLGAGGSVVITPDQLGEIVAAQAPDTPLEMVVDRGGSVSSVAVTVGQKPKASLSPSWVDT